MASFLDGKMARDIAKAFRGKLSKMTIHRVVSSGRDPVTGDNISSAVQYKAEGAVDYYSAAYKAAAGIPAEDVRITLIAGLCGIEPKADDQIVVKKSGSVYQIRAVTIDAADATYVCQSFLVQGAR